jgi:hypothetical protein
MRQPLRPVSRGRRITKAYPIPASTKGWLANQAISQMDPEGAVVLMNWFPKPDALQVRNGSLAFAQTPETVPVGTLMTYISGNSSNIFAACNGKIYDVTAGGAISSSLASGFSNDLWQYINMSTAGGLFLIAVNGQDPPQFFNGTTWAALSPAITGPSNPNALIQVWNYKQRLWFVEQGTQNVWYLAPASIGGAATQFPLGELLTLGGPIQVGGTWTHDAGFGPQDYCAFISQEGEVLLYSGSDPTTPSGFTLIGHFYIGRPIGRRCILRSGADLVINCSDGIMPMSKAIQFDRASAAKQAFTWNILDAFTQAYSTYGHNTGWEILSYAKGTMAIVNIPSQPGFAAIQYVMNTLTGAWCQFTGINSATWTVREDDLLFGGMSGNVLTADSGSADYNGSTYTPINAQWISAFNDLGMKGISKSARLGRPVFIVPPPINPGVGVCVDYNLNAVTSSQTFTFSNQALWDVALWDVATWPATNPTQANWQNVSGDGYQFAATVAVNSLPSAPTIKVVCKLTEMNILYEPGGYI